MPRFAFYLLCLLVALLPLQGSAAVLAACPQMAAMVSAASAAEHGEHCAQQEQEQVQVHEQASHEGCASSLACCAAACVPMTIVAGHPSAPATVIPASHDLSFYSVVPAMLERPPRAHA